MENSKREIESFLYLYPSAIKYYDSIKYNQQKVSNKQLKQMETFYGILIDIVNDWMKVLLKDEIVIIKYKYFNCLNDSGNLKITNLDRLIFTKNGEFTI